MNEAKIKLLTYRPKDDDRDRILSSPLQRAMEKPKRSSTPLATARSSSLADRIRSVLSSPDSRLLALPFELLHQIFYYLPIETLGHLLGLSWRAYLAVTAHEAYPLILTHLRPLIRVLHLTHLQSSFTLSHLLSTVYTSECAVCSHAAEYLFLPSLERGCDACIRSADPFLPMKPTAVRKRYGLRRKDLVGVPQMRTLVGTYGWDRFGGDEWRTKRDILMDNGLVRQRAMELGKSKAAPVVSRLNCSPSRRRSLALIRFPSVDQQTGQEEIYIRCAGCRQIWEEARQDYIRGVRYGYLNFRGEVEDMGIHRLQLHSSWFYTGSGWLAHFEECKRSQEMWRKSIAS